ncbi:cytochrome c-type biogenesis protein CcmH [Nesterenkonia lutea]|uniref:Cytochrome c-type biogenesis protein n=1 Tax=Nesterenkonia lutea TaxID=272919 RepID=A0ABR9JC02_9MICC|nr:cytochrome c-type biogenesis protein [Nesterenkonia lutea]MBE1523456.1 cytochrome c-type biogenesis protein CcmH/NrfF [Nesterenkonia lutea]
MKRLLRWLIVAAVVIFAVASLVSAAVRQGPETPEQTAREVSQSLRCPTCAGESIADSAALLSDAMRQTVRDQLEQGRSPEEVRSWFAERYGDEVLLEPPRRGYGWLLWGFPLVLTAATVVVGLRGQARSRRWLVPLLAAVTVAVMAAVWVSTTAETAPRPTATAGHAEDTGSADTVAVLRAAVQDSPGDTPRRLALAGALEQSGDTAAAAQEYAAAVRLQPMDPDLRYRYAFALVRDEQVDEAVAVLEETLAVDEAHAPSLLLLGALLREEQPERSARLLAQFAELDPENPAVEQITELQEQGQILRDPLP